MKEHFDYLWVLFKTSLGLSGVALVAVSAIIGYIDQRGEFRALHPRPQRHGAVRGSAGGIGGGIPHVLSSSRLPWRVP